MKKPAQAETLDSILGGRLSLYQPADGYRFSVEAILLGRFVRARASDRVLELGAGCGVVSVMVAALSGAQEVVAMELQPALAGLIARNAALNGLSQVSGLRADLRARRIEGLKPASFDLVVANPPYRARNTGRESPKEGRRIARGGGGASLAEFLDAARRYARDGGSVAIIFTAARCAELIAEMRRRSLEPKRIRFVHPRADLPASTVLVEACKGGGVEAEVEPSLVLRTALGGYSPEANRLLSMY
jgi:tRNA1(Val) A37 N6-methylase TrmN6